MVRQVSRYRPTSAAWARRRGRAGAAGEPAARDLELEPLPAGALLSIVPVEVERLHPSTIPDLRPPRRAAAG